MPTPIEELRALQSVLQIEKEADFEHFKRLLLSLSLHERCEKGFTWYPLEVVKSGYTYGNRAYVTVRKTGEDSPHQFRSGRMVRLFTQAEDVGQCEKKGVVRFVDKTRMKIVLHAKDLPDWLHKGLLGVDLMFDERTYLEMEKALSMVMAADRNRLAELRAILLGQQQTTFRPIENPIHIPQLNTSQNNAVNHILASENVTIVHGPPGTGKTTTISYAIKLLTQREQQVLVTAPSNTAADLLTERLAAMDLTVVRVGNISRVDESIIRHTLEARLAEHPDSKTIKKVKIQAAEARRKARRYKRSFGHKERQERNAYWQEARELSAWANQLEERLLEQILHSAHIITCTLVGASNKVLEKMNFQTVFIDEAAQALEPATWIPVCKASKVVLTGDPYQLPPTVKSKEAQQQGLTITLLEKCIERHQAVHLLNVQYRMHTTIMGFSNQQFYADQLLADASVADSRLLYDRHTPLVFIDTAGCGFDEKINEEHKSRYNPDEYNILREHIYQLSELYNETPFPEVAIISPYREQVIFMETAIANDAVLSALDLSVHTIDGFQGQERAVMYISLVRSNTKEEIGFLKDYRRMNVAMTRAKQKLVVIGDSATIGNDPFYEKFLDYCEKNGTYQSAWEYMS